jgi:hypothetical protein
MIAEPPFTEVRFKLPYSLPFDGVFEFEWADDIFWVKIESIPLFDRRSEEVVGLKVSSGGSVSVASRHGLSHLSEVVVRFRKSFETPGPGESGLRVADSDRSREHACEAVNRVIEVYRESTNDFRVKRVMPEHDVISFKYERVEIGGGGTQGFALGVKRKLLYPVKVRHFGQVRALVHKRLRAKAPIPIWKDYTHAARRFFEEREFALAVVLANTALELFWAEVLRQGLESQGLAPEKVKQQMEKWTTPTRTRSTLTLFDEGLQQVFQRSLQSEESDLWGEVNQARVLRKNVVHPWPKRPDADETLRAMTAIENALLWLNRIAVSQKPPSTPGETRKS